MDYTWSPAHLGRAEAGQLGRSNEVSLLSSSRPTYLGHNDDSLQDLKGCIFRALLACILVLLDALRGEGNIVSGLGRRRANLLLLHPPATYAKAVMASATLRTETLFDNGVRDYL